MDFVSFILAIFIRTLSGRSRAGQKKGNKNSFGAKQSILQIANCAPVFNKCNKRNARIKKKTRRHTQVKDQLRRLCEAKEDLSEMKTKKKTKRRENEKEKKKNITEFI